MIHETVKVKYLGQEIEIDAKLETILKKFWSTDMGGKSAQSCQGGELILGEYDITDIEDERNMLYSEDGKIYEYAWIMIEKADIYILLDILETEFVHIIMDNNQYVTNEFGFDLKDPIMVCWKLK